MKIKIETNDINDDKLTDILDLSGCMGIRIHKDSFQLYDKAYCYAFSFEREGTTDYDKILKQIEEYFEPKTSSDKYKFIIKFFDGTEFGISLDHVSNYRYYPSPKVLHVFHLGGGVDAYKPDSVKNFDELLQIIQETF